MPTPSLPHRLFLLALLMPLLAKAQIDPRLLTAIHQNNSVGVEAALKAGANPNATDSLGATSLMWACYQADTTVVKLLVQHGAKTECRGVIRTDTSTYYGNLTGLAAGLNKLPLLRYLLETLKLPVNEPEYNPETKKNDGWTPVEWAAFNGHLAVLTYLAEHRGDLNVAKGNPLVLALQRQRKEVIAFLLEQGFSLEKDHPDYAVNLNNMAEWYRFIGPYEKALPFYEESRTIREKVLGKLHPEYGTALNNLAVLYQTMGQYEQALPLYLEAQAIWAKGLGKTHPNYVALLGNLGDLYKSRGQYEQALTLLLEAKEIQVNVLGKTHPNYALSLIYLAVLYRTTGQYELALPLLLEAKEIWAKGLGKTHPNYMALLGHLGDLYQAMGQYEQAMSLYLEAKEIGMTVLGKIHPNYALALINLAELYWAMGQYEQALSLYLEAKEIWAKSVGKTHPDYAQSLNNLAELYRAMGQYEQALPLYLEAKEIRAKSVGKTHPDYALSLNNLAILYQDIGQHDQALSLVQEAKEIWAKSLGKTHPNYALALINLALLYQNMGYYEKVISLLLESRKQYRTQLVSQIGILNETALGQFQEKFDSSNLAYSLGYTTHSKNLAGQYYTDALLSKGVGLMASQLLNTLLNQTKDSTTIRTGTQLRDIKLILNRQLTLPLAKQRGVDSLHRKAADLEQQLVQRLPEYGQAFTALRLEWPQVQQALKSDEAAIEFISFRYCHKRWTDSTLYAALILRPGYTQPKFVFLGEQRQLDTLLITGAASPSQINGLYRGVVIEGNNNPLARGLALSKLIWQPLDSLLQGVKTVYVSPAGRLHQIALAALPNPADTSQRMADRFQIRQVGSTRVVALRTAKTEQPLAKNSLKASLYGGITYEADSVNLIRQKLPKDVQHLLALREATRSGTWDYLPGTQAEVDNLSKILPSTNTTILTGQAATESSVKALSGHSPKVLHIATHGFFFPDLPKPKTDGLAVVSDERNRFQASENPLLRSGLVMAGANYVWKGGTPIEGIDDGILTAYELSNLNLNGTELVVLSACETGLGQVKGSEGVYGLQRAVKMAGARYLLMSLWRVSDKETAEYMTMLYRKLLDKSSVPEAYAYAQHQMRLKYPREPFKWAAFVLVE